MNRNWKQTKWSARYTGWKSFAGWLGIGAMTTLSLSPAAAQAQALKNKADAFLTHTAHAPRQSGWASVIVRIDGPLTSKQQSQLRTLGASVYRHLPIIHSLALRVPTRHLDRLAALPFVQHLSSDTAMHKTDEFTVESSGAGMAFQQYSLTGQSVRVAVIDSGIHNQNDFGNQTITGWPKPVGGGNRLVAQINFVPDSKGNVNSGDVDDKCGHGTHVAGVIGGNGTNSSQNNCYRTFYGIAPQADLINVRVLDQNGQGTVSQVISGIQWVVSNKAKYNIRVINLSVGHPVGESYTTDPLCQAVESAWKAGIVVVCAAGNQGRIQNFAVPFLDNEGYGTNYGSIQCPGNDPYVITVGAMKASDMVISTNGTWTHNRSNDHIATYSSRGPSRLDLVLKPDIVAPGNKIISVDSNNSFLDNVDGNTNDIKHNEYITKGDTNWSNNYYRLSGTSMAAPVVSGAVALLLQANPNLTPDTIKARLMLSADKWADPSGNMNPCTYGAGYLNIPAALQCTAVPNQWAISPSMGMDYYGNVFINMDRAIWGTSSVNGSRAIWGVNGINDLRAIWGTSTNVLDASRAIWGTSVWSDRAIWGTDSSAVDLTSTAIKGEN